MRTILLVLFCLGVTACSRCTIVSPPCSPLECYQGHPSFDVRQTALKYEVAYGVETYEVKASFDVHFLDGSSTNGCTATFVGTYDQPVQSDELHLNGKRSDTPYPGELAGTVASSKKYYLKGTIARPENEEIVKRNLRSLTLHVEESYEGNYSIQ